MNTQLQQAQGIEGMGQQALELGSALGGRIANPEGARALQSGGNLAAQTLADVQRYNPMAATLMGASTNPALTGALGNWTSGLFNTAGPGGMPTGSMGGISPMGGNAARGFTYGGF